MSKSPATLEAQSETTGLVKRRLVLSARLAILTAAIVLVFDQVRDNIHDFRAIENVFDLRVVPIALLSTAIMLLAALRFWLGVLKSEPRHTYLASLRHVSVSRLLNLLIPQSGFAYKIQSLMSQSGLRAPQALSQLFVFIWLDIVTTLLIATFLLSWLQPGLAIEGIPMLAGFVAATGGVLALTLAGRPIVRLAARLANTTRLAGKLTGRLDELDAFFDFRKPNIFVLQALGIITISVLISIWRMGLCFELFDVQFDWAILGLFVVLNRLSNIVTLTPGNLGVLELAYGLLSKAFGMGLAEGVLVSLTLRVVTFLTLVVLSLLTVVHARMTDRPTTRCRPS